MRLWKAALAAVLCCALPVLAFGQGAILQSQTVTPGHPAAWVANGVIADGISPTVGPLLSTLGVQSSSACSLFANSGPITAGYEQLCLGVSGTGSATLSVLGVAGLANQALQFNVPSGLIPPSWTTAQRPSGPAAGTFGYNSTAGNLDLYNGSAWVSPIPSACSKLGAGAADCAAGNYVVASVLTYGAKCDGATDDSAAIAAALSSGLPVSLPPSTVCVVASATPIAVGNVNVALYGSGTSELKFTGANGGIQWSPTTTGRSLEIAGVTFITTVANGGTAISIIGAPTTGTQLAYARIHSNLFSGDDTLPNPSGVGYWTGAISTNNTSDSAIYDNTMYGAGWTFATTAAISINGNHPSPGNAMRHNIYDNAIFNSKVSIAITTAGQPGVEGVHIHHNRLVGSATGVLASADSAYFPPGILVNGNETGQNAGPAFAISGFSQVSIDDNILYANGAGDNTPSFTGVIAGPFLTASSVTGNLAPGQLISGAGVPAGTIIVSAGATAGTFNLNHSATIASEAMTAGVPIVLLANAGQTSVSHNKFLQINGTNNPCIQGVDGANNFGMFGNVLQGCHTGISLDSTTFNNVISGTVSSGGVTTLVTNAGAVASSPNTIIDTTWNGTTLLPGVLGIAGGNQGSLTTIPQIGAAGLAFGVNHNPGQNEADLFIGGAHGLNIYQTNSSGVIALSPVLSMDASGNLVLNNNNGLQFIDSAGSAHAALTLTDTNPDVLLLKNNQRNLGGTISFQTGVAGTTTWNMDGTGGLFSQGVAGGSKGSGTINVLGYYASGTAGVSCAAGTVNLTTLVVTSGLVTHC